MPARLTFDSLAAATPNGRRLFESLSLSIAGERVGLVGRNGSGKSTLLRIVAGEVAPLAGSLARTGSVGMLRQSPSGGSADEALGVADALAKLQRTLSGELADDVSETDWTLPARIEVALSAAGLSGLELSTPVNILSGGERMRLAIARILLEAPDILLLDEPTNNLDAGGRRAVAGLIAGWRGAALVASHDRELLERMDRIVELTPVGVSVFGGGWSAFAAAREARRAQAAAELERAERFSSQAARTSQERREAKDRKDSRGRLTRTRRDAPKMLLDARQDRAEQTGGRINRIAERLASEADARLAEARGRVEILTPLAINLPPSGLHASQLLLSLEAAEMAIDGRRLWGAIDLEIRGPRRLAVSGPNGSGKTLLLQVAAGRLAPTSGQVRAAADGVAWLDQHVDMLDDRETLLANMRRLNPELSVNEAHAALARFAFRNQWAERVAGDLSGGERLRLGLACVLSRPAPPALLLLDEPTNHLDIDAVETLERALASWDGALMVVSHDRAFLSAVGVEDEIVLKG
jgi:ATPase subunit of ABC transporter with duplicated ATPase domains